MTLKKKYFKQVASLLADGLRRYFWKIETNPYLQKAYTPKAYLTLTVSNALNWQKQRHGQAMLAVYLLNEIIKGFPFSKARDSCPFLSRFCWWIIRRALLSIDRMLLRGVLKPWTSFRFIPPYGPFAGKSLVIVVIRHLLITHARVTGNKKILLAAWKNMYNKEEITLIS